MTVVAVDEFETLAREALAEFTRAGDVGDLIDRVSEGDDVTTLHFATSMRGYPGWRWTVSLARLDGAEPTVLEAELLPGDGALLAPDWIPWSERLEEWRAQQAAEAAARAAEEGADDASEEDSSDGADDAAESAHDGPDGSDDAEHDDDPDDDDDEDDDEDEDDELDDFGDDVYDGLDPEAAAGYADDEDR